MSMYRVAWIIDIDADNPKDAADKAAKLMQRKASMWSYGVEDIETGEIIAVDTEEEETEE